MTEPVSFVTSADVIPTRTRPARPRGELGNVEGDLRPVTVLFADIRGFTRLSEVLPPEKLVAAINGCFDVLDTAISHYGGEIDKFLGDAVMATFGAPVAHDDDPRRAVLAALEMQTALSRYNASLRKQIGCELEMRVGINTGMVLAGPIGSLRKRTFTVMGDAVNVAARLEHAAPVGSILIGEATRAALGDTFRLRQRRSVRIRGKDAPVRSYVVLGRTTASRTRHVERFLGRDAEIETLLAHVPPSKTKQRFVVDIDGSMGVGKSAFAEALRHTRTMRNRTWLNVGCPPYGQDLPYTTVAGLLRGLLQRLSAVGTPEDILAQSIDAEGLDIGLAAAVVRDLLAASAPSTDDRVANLPAQLRKGLLARATKAFLRAASLMRPIVVAVDDCHWLDAASAAILQEAIADLSTCPITWLVIHRPTWALPTDWPVEATLRLQPLDLDTSTRLATLLLGEGASNAEISFVVERAEGNPLYLVELCSAVGEAGIPTETRGRSDSEDAAAQPRHLTDQLRSLILSRVDALDERARRAAHVAAVLGHAFPATLIRRVLGPGDWGAVLARLEEHAVLQRESRVRGDGRGTTWIWHFRHPLVQETVYASLLSGTRTTLHRSAGDALEHMTDEAVADRIALLALHFGRSDDRVRAVRYLCAAGDRARLLNLNREAIHYYEDALGRLGNSGSDRAERAQVLGSLGGALDVLAEDEAALDSLRAAAELAQAGEARANLWRQIADIHRRRGTYAAAQDMLQQAEATLAEGPADPIQLARVRVARAMLAIERSAFAEARVLAREATNLLAHESSTTLDRAAAFRAAGIAAARQNDLPAARDAFVRALDSATKGQDAVLSATISLNLGTVLHLQGEREDALKLYHQALEFHERVGAKRGVALAANNLGDLYWSSGSHDADNEQALRYWQRSLRLYEEIGDQRGLATVLRNLGEMELGRDGCDAAEPYLRRAATLALELDDTELATAVKRMLTRVWAARETTGQLRRPSRPDR
ncbi:MAG: adenylate/guanylate cyclase domain-containing protein [Chloroflexota bacterium]